MLSFLFHRARMTAQAPRRIPVSRRRAFVPRLEALEDRSLPSTLSVVNLADSGAGSLRGQLAAAAPGDTIDFAPGLSGTLFLGSVLDVTKGLTVQGPGPDALTLYGQEATQVFRVEAGVTAGISGLTVAGGWDTEGGGIHNDGSLTLDRVTVRDNQAGMAGLMGWGGGLFNAPGASLTVTRSTFLNNGAYTSGMQGGGGIYNGGTLSVTGTAFSGNWVEGWGVANVLSGSALYNAPWDLGAAPTAAVDSCTFNANGNNSICSSGTLTLRGSTISGDRLFGVACSGTATIDSCTVTGNGVVPGDSEGGVQARGSLTLVNSTVAGNAGAGLTVWRGTNTSPTSIAIADCTIAGNTYDAPPSGDSGAGIDVMGNGTSPLITLHNTILAGNVVLSGGTPILKDLNTSTFTSILVKPPRYESLGWNLIQAPGGATLFGTTTGNQFGVDPLLGPLADNGGSTMTMALLPGSPALDAGDGTGAPAYDQRGVGFARVVGAGIDIGAFEAQPAGVMTHFGITAPASAVAGTPFPIDFQALDDLGNRAPGYVGPVHLTATDGLAVLTQDCVLTGADAGAHAFSVTLTTAGTQVFTVTAGTPGGPLTQQGSLIVSPASAASLRLSAPATTTAGQAVSVLVTLLDAYGNVAAGYTGTVHFTSSDAKAVLPADYTFTSADAGTHTFSVTLKTAGARSITIADTRASSLTATVGIVVNPAAAAKFVLTAPASVTHGVLFSLTLTVQDAYGNVVTGYTGTVHFTSSDGTAILPANYTFTAADAGVHTFANSAILRKKGTQTLTVTDLASSALTAAVRINVT
jgi:hypothetical protein